MYASARNHITFRPEVREMHRNQKLMWYPIMICLVGDQWDTEKQSTFILSTWNKWVLEFLTATEGNGKKYQNVFLYSHHKEARQLRKIPVYLAYL